MIWGATVFFLYERTSFCSQGQGMWKPPWLILGCRKAFDAVSH